MKFQMTKVLSQLAAITSRLGAGTGSGNWIDSKETNKLVKLVGDSRYDLCVAGDPIQGFIESVEAAPQDSYSIGAVRLGGTINVMADGSEAAGTGSIAIGDYVVAGAITAKGTAVTLPKVRKATNQPGAVPGDLTAAGQQARNAIYAWRVVAINTGTGAVGDTLTIQRENYPA